MRARFSTALTEATSPVEAVRTWLYDNRNYIDAVDRELYDGVEPVNEPDWAALPAVREDETSRYTERGVDARRGLSREQMLAQFAETHALRSEQLRAADPSRFGWRQPPYEYEAEKMPIDILAGSPALREAIDAGARAADIAATWTAGCEAFRRQRASFLRYD